MFFHLDFIGSVVMVTDDTGTSSYATILESYRYDSYGTPTFRDGDGGARSSSSYEQDKLYTGRRFDPELGTYYYRARTMSSATGAFLSRDPIWTWGSLYSYVGNRPIDRIDPMGEQVADTRWGAARDASRGDANRAAEIHRAISRVPVGRMLPAIPTVPTPEWGGFEAACLSVLAGVVNFGSGVINSVTAPFETLGGAIGAGQFAAGAVTTGINAVSGSSLPNSTFLAGMDSIKAWFASATFNDYCSKIGESAPGILLGIKQVRARGGGTGKGKSNPVDPNPGGGGSSTSSGGTTQGPEAPPFVAPNPGGQKVQIRKTPDTTVGESPVAPRAGGSTGRTVAESLREKLAMEQVVSSPGGIHLQNIVMSDPRWPAADGWVKMAQNVNGVEIHYVLNLITGAVDDFKFK
jgi:RHS repeat-associated protein